MAMTGCMIGKIRKPYATVAGCGISVQLEVAILAADAGSGAACCQQAGVFFRRAVGVGETIVVESS
jgi:hypothetical protein